MRGDEPGLASVLSPSTVSLLACLGCWVLSVCVKGIDVKSEGPRETSPM